MLCGHYRKTPDELVVICPADLMDMMDGVDWVNDRDWLRALFVRTGHAKTVKDLWRYNYPHFRKPRVVKVIHSDDPVTESADG